MVNIKVLTEVQQNVKAFSYIYICPLLSCLNVVQKETMWSLILYVVCMYVVCGNLQNWSLYPHTLMYSHGTWPQWFLGRVTHVTSRDVGQRSSRGQWPLVQVFCKKSHCIHILWCIFIGLGHNDPWVESHMWPQQMWGQRLSRGQWPLIQVFAKRVTVSTYSDVFSWDLDTMILG